MSWCTGEDAGDDQTVLRGFSRRMEIYLVPWPLGFARLDRGGRLPCHGEPDGGHGRKGRWLAAGLM